MIKLLCNSPYTHTYTDGYTRTFFEVRDHTTCAPHYSFFNNFIYFLVCFKNGDNKKNRTNKNNIVLRILYFKRVSIRNFNLLHIFIHYFRIWFHHQLVKVSDLYNEFSYLVNVQIYDYLKQRLLQCLHTNYTRIISHSKQPTSKTH